MKALEKWKRAFETIGHDLFQILFEYLAQVSKANNPHDIYAIDTCPVAVCDNIRISRCGLYQSEEWHGKIASKRLYF